MSVQTPTALKKLQGNPGHRPYNTQEPKPSNSRPRPPQWLSKDARKMWNTLSKPLHECGLLTMIDSLALGLLCENFATWKEANDVIKKHGSNFDISKKGRYIAHYAYGIRNTAQHNLIPLLKEFGLTPSARSSIKIPQGDGSQVSLADMLFEAVKRAP